MAGEKRNMTTGSRFDRIDCDVLTPIVQKVLDNPNVRITEWSYQVIKGDGTSLKRLVCRFSGQAKLQEKEIPWSIFLKIPNPTHTHLDVWHREPFQREPLLYQSGVLDNLPGGISAPRCLVNDRDFTDALNTSKRVLIYGNAAARSKETSSIGGILSELDVKYALTGNLNDLDDYSVLIIGKDALDNTIQTNGARIYRWTESGGRLLCLEQSKPGTLPFLPEVSVAAERGEHKDILPGARFTEVLVREHPIFRGLDQEDFMDWNGEDGLLFNWGIYPLNEGMLSVGPTIRGLGGRTDSLKMVSTAYSVGTGEMLLSQYNAVERYGQDPIATRFMQNLIEYILTEPRSDLSLPFASVKMREK